MKLLIKSNQSVPSNAVRITYLLYDDLVTNKGTVKKERMDDCSILDHFWFIIQIQLSPTTGLKALKDSRNSSLRFFVARKIQVK